MGGPEMAPQPPHPLVAPRRSRGAPRPHPLVAPRRSRGAPRPQPLVAPRRSRGAPRPQPLVAPRRSRGTPRYADTRLVCDPRRHVTPLAHAPVHRLTIDRDERRRARPRRVEGGLFIDLTMTRGAATDMPPSASSP